MFLIRLLYTIYDVKAPSLIEGRWLDWGTKYRRKGARRFCIV